MKILVDDLDLGNIVVDSEGNAFIVNEFEGQDFVVVITPKPVLGRELPKVSYTRGTTINVIGYTDTVRRRGNDQAWVPVEFSRNDY